MVSIVSFLNYVLLMIQSLLKLFSTSFNMNSQKKHLQHVMFHCFKKDDNTNDTADEICTIYRRGATTITTIRNWFKKFRAGNFDLKSPQRSSSSDECETYQGHACKICNVREITNTINIPRITLHNHLIRMGCQQSKIWVLWLL